jgi:signal transduction histidine kinase
VWNRTGKSLTIVIHPPFWKENWFITIGVLLLIGMIAGLFKLRTNQIQKQNKKLEALVNERTHELALRQAEILKRNNDLRMQAEKLLQQNEEIERQRDTILENSRELEVKNEELSSLNKEKNYLMSIVAHDLRNPLATLKSFVDILIETPDLDEEEKQHILKVMDTSIDRQFDMITKILDIRSAESGQLNLQIEPVNFTELITSIVDMFKPKAAQKMLYLKLDSQVNKGTKLYIESDKHYLSQIVENLLSNAIKFSPAGTEIMVKMNPVQNTIRIGIQDQGPGISSEDQKKLFGKFQRLSALPTGGESSTGLGLSIVKRFTEALGGKVWCESELGKGATFWVEFSISSEG